MSQDALAGIMMGSFGPNLTISTDTLFYITYLNLQKGKYIMQLITKSKINYGFVFLETDEFQIRYDFINNKTVRYKVKDGMLVP